MLTKKEMRLISEAITILANCTSYRLSLDGKTICDFDDTKDAAAEVVAFMSQTEFYQLVANNEVAE